MRRVAGIWAGLVCAVHCADVTPQRLIETGHWKRARAVVEERLRTNPDDAEANYLGSMIRAAFGDRESPMKLAEKAVSLEPGVARYHRLVAEVIGVTAQHSNAFQQLFLARRFRKEIDAAIALDGSDLQSLRDLLEYYLLAPGLVGGDKAKAQGMAARIAKVDAAAGYSTEARVASFSGKRDAALAMLRKAVEASPGNYKARIELARFCLEEPRDLHAAETEALAAVRIDSTRVDGYSVLAQVYGSGGRWSELDAILAEARKQVADDGSPLYYAGAGASAGGDAARAERYLREYIGMVPEGNAPTAAEARAKLAALSPGDRKPAK
jgi:tetratricopeptide (TPR) repeat protein